MVALLQFVCDELDAQRWRVGDPDHVRAFRLRDPEVGEAQGRAERCPNHGPVSLSP